MSHCPHADSWMVGPGRIMFGEVCCKCDQEVDPDNPTECKEKS